MLLAFVAPVPQTQTDERTYYYCWSRSTPAADGKIQIGYSDIMQMSANPDSIRKRTSEWWLLIESQCGGEQGMKCTSDLNIANSFEDGQRGRADILKRYTDTIRYRVNRLAF